MVYGIIVCSGLRVQRRMSATIRLIRQNDVITPATQSAPKNWCTPFWCQSVSSPVRCILFAIFVYSRCVINCQWL